MPEDRAQIHSNSMLILDYCMNVWNLKYDGELLATYSSLVQPVQSIYGPGILKVSLMPEERRGASLMEFWNGDGVARLLQFEETAQLMERLSPTPSLIEMASSNDDAATKILCETAMKLHSNANQSWKRAVPLKEWFKDLLEKASAMGRPFEQSAAIAQKLIQENENPCILHGDIHHGNVLNCERGWLAIDPKGLIGPSGFDFANILCNPDPKIALREGRLEAQAKVISTVTGQSFERVLQWAAAWSALSSVWILSDDLNADDTLEICHRSHALLES